jgi:thioredoxin reductase (NADPH)
LPTPDLKAPQALVQELKANPRVTLHKNISLREILGKEQVEAVRFEPKGNADVTLPVKGAFVYLQGGRPITDFLQGQLEVNPGGCLVVDREFRTTVPDVYAVGDVLCKHIKQVIVAAEKVRQPVWRSKKHCTAVRK